MFSLFAYQEVGVEFLVARKFAIIGDEMGLGKTVQAIRAADKIGAKRIIVVCKAIGRDNWRIEFEKFSSVVRDYHVVFDRVGATPPAVGVTIVSYDLLDAVLQASTGRFDVAIIDEAHTVKNPETKRTKLVLGKNGVLSRSDRVWELSGTIAPNNASELWIHLFVSGKTRLSYDQFVEKYCITRQTSYGLQIMGTNQEPKILQELKSMLSPIFLRRLSGEAGLNLPEIFYQEIVVRPGKVDLSLSRKFQPWVHPYDKTAELNLIIEREMGILGGIVNGEFKNEVVEALIASANSISTVRAYMAQQKVEPVFDLVSQELDEGAYQKIVIFAIHRDMIEALEMKFKNNGNSVVKIYGGLEPKKITKRIEEFQNQKGCQILLGNILSAGTTITLTSSNQVLFAEQDFVTGNNAQALKRIHRIGQSKTCFVRVVSLANSFDQHVNRLLARKSEELAKLMSDDGKIKPKSILRTRQQPAKTDISDLF